MHAERLLRLADHLETTVAAMPPERFNMRTWGMESRCGTVCCALGHAAQIPEFQELGLRLEWEHDEATDTRHADVIYRERIGYGAAQAFFDLTPEGSRWLFRAADYAGAPVTPAVVAARIRELVARMSEAQG